VISDYYNSPPPRQCVVAAETPRAVTITMKFVRGKRNYVPHFLYLDSPFSIDFLITFVKLLHYELSNEEDKSINQSNKQTKNP